MTISCGRCRALILDSSEVVVVRIGTFPPRRVCSDCAQLVQLELVTPPSMHAALPFDRTPH